MDVRRLIVVIVSTTLLVAHTTRSAPPPKPAADREPITDPVVVGRDGAAWSAYRYETALGQWSAWKGPEALVPFKMFTSVGPHAAAVLDPKKGFDGWLFDLHARTWRPMPLPPLAGSGPNVDPHVVAFIGDSLLLWGWNSQAPHGAVLDTKTMQWKVMAPAPVPPRVRCANAVVAGKLIVWGGYGPNNPARPRGWGPLTDGAIYDPATDKWDTLPETPAPAPTYGYVWTATENRFILFGGLVNKALSPGGFAYDPAMKTWEPIPPAPADVGLHSAAATVGNRLFLWSGSDPDREKQGRGIPTADGAVYDFKTRQWQKLPPAPIPPRKLPSARAQGAQVIVWGGWEGGGPATFLRDAAAYDLDKGTWRILPDFPSNVPYALHPGW